MLGALALGRWEKLVKSWVVFGIWAREKGGGNSWLYIGFFFFFGLDMARGRTLFAT